MMQRPSLKNSKYRTFENSKIFNPFNPEVLKYFFPSLHLDTSIAAKRVTIVNSEKNGKQCIS